MFEPAYNRCTTMTDFVYGYGIIPRSSNGSNGPGVSALSSECMITSRAHDQREESVAYVWITSAP